MGELELYSIGNLKNMEVIDVNTGTKLGFIKDLIVDSDEYKIISIILPMKQTSLFSKQDDLEIKWNKIKKIGVDVILVDENLEIFQGE